MAANENEIDEIYEDLKNADFTDTARFKSIPTPDFILKARLQAQANAFDTDIVNWVTQQDKNTRNHINSIIRHLMAVQQLKG